MTAPSQAVMQRGALSDRALERLLKAAILAGKPVRIRDGEIVFNEDEPPPVRGFDMVDLRK